MQKINLTAHMVIKNDDRFVWYAISSVLPFVDKLLISDTGSTDNTVRIIESFRDRKIEFKKIIANNADEISKARNDQILATVSDWIWIVDADEIYSTSSVKEILNILDKKGEVLEGVAVGRYDLLGDIYHYQSDSVGSYDLFGQKGHHVLRLINRRYVPNLHVSGTYPNEGYYDAKNIEIIHHSPGKFEFTKGSLWHTMYLTRSTSGNLFSNTFNRGKFKIELGNKFIANTKLPEVFFVKKPDFIPKVTMRRSFLYEIVAHIITPLKMFKRFFLN